MKRKRGSGAPGATLVGGVDRGKILFVERWSICGRDYQISRLVD